MISVGHYLRQEECVFISLELVFCILCLVIYFIGIRETVLVVRPRLT